MREVIVAVLSSVITAGVLWGVAQAGGFVKRIAIPKVPGGAVLAFDGQCPNANEGWKPYAKAEGRFILGVGTGPLNGQVHIEQLGGAEEVQLMATHLPGHSHDVLLSSDTEGGGSGIRGANNNSNGAQSRKRAVSEGEASPHNNMPPFVALTFCQKIR